MSKSMDELLQKKRVLITCGTGGVGKTTLSAALALRAATLGRNAVVITIDPAKRLKTSLGVETLGDEPTNLTEPLRAVAGNEPIEGQFSAIVPDTQKTFDQFVRSLAPSEAVAQRILKNSVFQVFTQEFSGTNEYMALERLYALEQSRQFDLIILDTPPSRNTLDFLNAPETLERFLDEKVMRWLIMPANQIVSIGMKKALGIMEKLAGSNFMTSLIEFLTALFEVRMNFIQNLRSIMTLLRSDDVGFIMVAGAQLDTQEEMEAFISSVETRGFHFDGVLLNRTTLHLEITDEERNSAKESSDLAHALAILEARQFREREAAERVKNRAQSKNLVFLRLPELEKDVHSLEDLYHVAQSVQP